MSVSKISLPTFKMQHLLTETDRPNCIYQPNSKEHQLPVVNAVYPVAAPGPGSSPPNISVAPPNPRSDKVFTVINSKFPLI